MLQKIYGKNPESFGDINKMFHNLLGKYPAEKVVKAVETWLERSQEFPTPADIVAIIKRNGKPPLKESDIVSIRKKDGEDRTSSEWKMLREWEEQQAEGWSDYADPVKDNATLLENIRLRQEVRDLRREAARAWDEVKRLRVYEQMKVIVSEEIQVERTAPLQKTIDYLKSKGAPESDIEELQRSHA